MKKQYNTAEDTSQWARDRGCSSKNSVAGAPNQQGNVWDSGQVDHRLSGSLIPSSPASEDNLPFTAETRAWAVSVFVFPTLYVPDKRQKSGYGGEMGQTDVLGTLAYHSSHLTPHTINQGNGTSISMQSLTPGFGNDSAFSRDSDALLVPYDAIVTAAPQLGYSVGSSGDFGHQPNGGSGEPTLSMSAEKPWAYQPAPAPPFESSDSGRTGHMNQNAASLSSWQNYEDPFTGASSNGGTVNEPFVGRASGSRSQEVASSSAHMWEYAVGEYPSLFPAATVVPIPSSSATRQLASGRAPAASSARQCTSQHGLRRLAPKPCVDAQSTGVHLPMSFPVDARHPQPMPKKRKHVEDMGAAANIAEADSSKTWPCPSGHCSRRFARPDNAKRHDKEWRENESRAFSFPCEAPGCAKGFSREDKLITHIAKDHPGFVYRRG
ncbi:hypothetical protein HWV62_22624 [Athelia sp. TMB]|nr:hypothetical protein HWV62_22624 [Athelia sp. TMB]